VTCESCGLPVYWFLQELSPVWGHCKDCFVIICEREECAAVPASVCCDECPVRGICFECMSLRWCPEYPPEIKAANLARISA
jgi:hypothetical protein